MYIVTKRQDWPHLEEWVMESIRLAPRVNEMINDGCDGTGKAWNQTRFSWYTRPKSQKTHAYRRGFPTCVGRGCFFWCGALIVFTIHSSIIHLVGTRTNFWRFIEETVVFRKVSEVICDMWFEIHKLFVTSYYSLQSLDQLKWPNKSGFVWVRAPSSCNRMRSTEGGSVYGAWSTVP